MIRKRVTSCKRFDKKDENALQKQIVRLTQKVSRTLRHPI